MLIKRYIYRYLLINAYYDKLSGKPIVSTCSAATCSIHRSQGDAFLTI